MPNYISLAKIKSTALIMTLLSSKKFNNTEGINSYLNKVYPFSLSSLLPEAWLCSVETPLYKAVCFSKPVRANPFPLVVICLETGCGTFLSNVMWWEICLRVSERTFSLLKKHIYFLLPSPTWPCHITQNQCSHLDMMRKETTSSE